MGNDLKFHPWNGLYIFHYSEGFIDPGKVFWSCKGLPASNHRHCRVKFQGIYPKVTNTCTWITYFCLTSENLIKWKKIPNLSTYVMSISLNVVNMAHVFWASFRRCAIRWRILFIFTCKTEQIHHTTEDTALTDVGT